MRVQFYFTMARSVLILAVMLGLPLAYASPSAEGPSRSTRSLTIRSNTIDRRFAYLDGFGSSGIKEIDGDDVSSLMSNFRPKATTKHKLASLLTIALFGTLLSQPLWGAHGGYWTTVIVTYVIYFIEALRSSTRRYLSNMLTPLEVKKMLNDLSESKPVLRWDVESYHYRYERDYSGQGRRSTFC